MKKTILILSFVLIFSSLVSAGLYPITMADLVHPTCNNNGRCDYFENSESCPGECKVTANQVDTSTSTSDETTTTTVLTSITTVAEIMDVENNEIDDEVIVRGQIITKETREIPWKLILSSGFVIFIIVLVILLYSWIKQKPKESMKGKVLRKASEKKRKETIEEDEFGLPSRPKRKFGI